MFGEEYFACFHLGDIHSLVTSTGGDLLHDIQFLLCGELVPVIRTSAALCSRMVFESWQFYFDCRWNDGARGCKTC